MTFGGNDFNDFPEIVPTKEITTKTEETILVFPFSRPWPWAYFLNGPNATASVAPTLIRPLCLSVRVFPNVQFYTKCVVLVRIFAVTIYNNAM